MLLRRKCVLVIEDEEVLRSSMVAGLRKLPDVDVVGAATLAEAFASLDRAPPDVVLSDIDLPDGLGVEIIGELARRRQKAPIIFVTAYRAAYGSLIPQHAGVEVLEKPVSLDTIRRAVSLRLGSEEVPSSPFSVADYVQLSCIGHHSVAIEVEARSGRGLIEIVQGELWSATDFDGAVGEAAFRSLAFVRDAKIACRATQGSLSPRNIAVSWEGALMEAARLLDEAQRDSAAVFDLASNVGAEESEFGALSMAWRNLVAMPGSSEAGTPTMPSVELAAKREAAEPVVPVEEEPTDPFDEVCDDAISALLAKDYPAAAAAFARARALRPDDPKVNANLKRLSELGFEPEP